MIFHWGYPPEYHTIFCLNPVNRLITSIALENNWPETGREESRLQHNHLRHKLGFNSYTIDFNCVPHLGWRENNTTDHNGVKLREWRTNSWVWNLSYIAQCVARDKNRFNKHFEFSIFQARKLRSKGANQLKMPQLTQCPLYHQPPCIHYIRENSIST